MGISRARWTAVGAAVALGVTTFAGATAGAAPQQVAPQASQSGWVVTMGDSAISGEAGRWAGNTNREPWRHDTGSDAYFDNPSGTAETTPGCHRSKAAEAHIGGGVMSLNLACSGARTYTQTGGDFKPGFDRYDDGTRKSQVIQLEDFVDDGNDVDAVVVLVGANNYGFADIVQRCVTNWLTSPWWWKNYCSDDSYVRNRFTSSAVEARTNEVRDAINNVVAAMDGDTDGWTLIVQTYWSPIPRGSQFRYSERGWTRQSVGGCGVWNRDANWANDTAVTKMNQALVNGAARSNAQDYVILDMSQSMNGHRLCEQGVGLLEEVGIGSWTDPNAPDRTEWVSQIRTLTTIFGPYQLQEGIHSSYWGQLAMRNCLRKAYNGGAVQGGTCVSTGGVNAQGEPNMALT